ncbi:MAG: aldehyde dehydrogenase family protein, partial [Clostridia bacterium]|nr:aldehyde dehydrogenase family protein [Clostridia bacterium]
MEWTEAEIAEIVKTVMREVNATKTPDSFDAASYCGRRFIGVYEDMKDAIAAAEAGYRAIREMRVEEREKLITSIRDFCRAEAPIMAKIGVAETKMGRVDHKTAKHLLVADKTPGTEDIVSAVKTGDCGLTLTEMAPFGVVGSITPSTNPSETVICNSIGMIAAGNGVVFNPHPNAIATSNYAVDLVNRACAAVGGPRVLVASVIKPTLETADLMYKHPAIRLLVCTGGPGVVKS